MKRLTMIAVAVAVLALGVVAIGGAAADEDDGLVGSFLARVAEKLGVSEDELQAAIDEASTETLDEGVAEGLLTEEQAERLQERGFPFAGGRMGHGRGQVMDAAAEVLDMTRADLMEQLQDGNSLAEVAADAEVVAAPMSVEDFKKALLVQVQAQLGELVAEEDLTETQGDEIYENINENIDDIVNAEGCPRGFGGMRGGPGGFGGLGFGPFSGDEAESTETSDVKA